MGFFSDKIENMNKTNKCNCRCGCNNVKPKEVKDDSEKSLVITWQRLISEGSTCPRCESTENEVDNAVLELKKRLNPSGIDVVLEKIELTIEEFKKNPRSSNSISFNGQLLEDVIGAKTGQSQCCDVCGDEECRTVEAQEKSYEIIPAEMIIEAGLKVAHDL